MKRWKEQFKQQMELIATLPTEVKKLAEQMDFVHTPREVLITNILEKIAPTLKQLSTEQRITTENNIEKYVDKKMMVHKYAEDSHYKDNPKQLIADVLNTDASKLIGDIHMEIDGANFTFYVSDPDDYKLLHSY